MAFGKKDEKDLLDIRGTVTKLESTGKGKVAKATITLDGNWGEVTLPATHLTLSQAVILRVVTEE